VSGARPGGQENHGYGSGYLEVAPRIPRGGPHHVCGVALCSVWHHTICILGNRCKEDAIWIPRGSPTDTKRWPQPRVWCGT